MNLSVIPFLEIADLNEAQRLFHGRGHSYQGLEHVSVDWLPPVVLITLYQEVESTWLEQMATELMAKVAGCQSVQVQYRCRSMAPVELLLGDVIDQTVVTESSLQYHIELGRAQNTGLFLDMKNGRDWVKSISAGKNVLNLFSYTCAFSVAAIAGSARQVVNIDLSKASLTKGRENHRLNKQSTDNVIFQGVDIFKSYGRLKKFGPYDVLISDPPSFQKGSVDIERDYSKIIRRLPQLMAPNGLVMLCLNSPDLDENFLFNTVKEECPQCQFVERILPPAVFKEAHQGKGLKVLVFKFVG